MRYAIVSPDNSTAEFLKIHLRQLRSRFWMVQTKTALQRAEDMSTVRDLQERWFWQISGSVGMIFLISAVFRDLRDFSAVFVRIISPRSENVGMIFPISAVLRILEDFSAVLVESCQNHLSCKSRTVDMSSFACPSQTRGHHNTMREYFFYEIFIVFFVRFSLFLWDFHFFLWDC